MPHPAETPMALGTDLKFSSYKRELPREQVPAAKKKQRCSKSVAFANEVALEKIHYFDPLNGHGAPKGALIADSDDKQQAESIQGASKLTEELTLLSTLHGRARRELRDISKHDLQTAMKYGIKTPGHFRNGEQRWKFEFGNTVFITDEHCTREITCYKKAIKIERAKITDRMLKNHYEAVRVLKDDPHLVSLCDVVISTYYIVFLKDAIIPISLSRISQCTTHSIIIVDQSGSMKACDVNGFRSRSDAAYGTLALDYIAEQLYQQGDGFFVDAVTVIEMNETGSILFHKEPLDWVSTYDTCSKFASKN